MNEQNENNPRARQDQNPRATDRPSDRSADKDRSADRTANRPGEGADASGGGARGADAWSDHGPIVEAIEKNSDKSIIGRVMSVTEVKFDDGVPTARALEIRTTGDGAADELVLIGPMRYRDGQKAACQTGDTVRADVCRTTIDGHSYWIARSLECKGTREVLLDENDSPAWEKSPGTRMQKE